MSPTGEPSGDPADEPTAPSDEAVEFCTLAEHVDDPEVDDDDYDVCVATYDEEHAVDEEPSEQPDDLPTIASREARFVHLLD